MKNELVDAFSYSFGLLYPRLVEGSRYIGVEVISMFFCIGI